MWHSAIILDSAGPLPLSVDGGFVTQGGTVQLMFSGSTYTVTAPTTSAIQVILDGQVQSEELKLYLNQANTHAAFATKVLMPQLAAGAHTLSLDFADAGIAAGLRSDANDSFQVVLTELPF
jgi:hypothetical protein